MRKKFISIAIVTGLLMVNTVRVFADPSGMGVPADEAAAMQSMYDSGMDPYEAYAQMYGITPSGPINSGGGGSSTQAPSTSTPKTSTTAPKAAPAPAPTPATDSTQKSNKESKQSSGGVSHDYDTITDAARDAFVYFTHDGKANSCYLNIKSTSSENKITGKELNATRTGKEAGEIRFVDKDKKVVSKWKFENWKSDDKYELDLTSSFEEKKDQKLPGSYELVFSDGSTVKDNNIEYTVNTGMKNTKLYVYTVSGMKYSQIYSGKTDKNGDLTFNPQMLTKYIISKTEIQSK